MEDEFIKNINEKTADEWFNIALEGEKMVFANSLIQEELERTAHLLSQICEEITFIFIYLCK